MSRNAFTLVELVIVLLIVGIMSALVSPRIADAMVSSRLRAAARAVASDIEYARQQAKQQGAAQTVKFSPANDTYEMPGLDDFDHPGEPFVVDLLASSYETSLDSASFGSTGTDLVLTFNRFGRPDFGGSVVLVAGSKQQTLQVDAVSGKVSVLP